MLHIEGNGLIASGIQGLQFHIPVLIHAAGVSDSKCCAQEAFDKDRKRLLRSLHKDMPVVYISSYFCGVQGIQTPYYQHKRALERLVLEQDPRHIVMRLPQVVGRGGNPNNLLNFFRTKISKGETIRCYQNALRNLVAVEDIRGAISFCLAQKVTGMCSFVAPFSYTPKEIVQMLAHLLKKEAHIALAPTPEVETILTFQRTSNLTHFVSQSDHYSREDYLQYICQRGL